MVLKVNPVPEKHKMSHKKKNVGFGLVFFTFHSYPSWEYLSQKSVSLLGFFFFFADFFLGLSLAVQEWEQKYTLEDEIY